MSEWVSEWENEGEEESEGVSGREGGDESERAMSEFADLLWSLVQRPDIMKHRTPFNAY